MPAFIRNRNSTYALHLIGSGKKLDPVLVESYCIKNKLDLNEVRAILNEAMVAGDSGGNPVNMAQGINSGDITNPGPDTLGTKKRKKKKHENSTSNLGNH